MLPATSSANRSRRFAVFAIAGLLAFPAITTAQTASTFTACTPGALANCAVIRLTSQLGAGAGGETLFQIAIRNLGSQTTPTLATSIYNLVFETGQASAPGKEIDAAVAPVAEGGARVTDAAEWDMFDSGNAIFLSALGNNGVGNCITGSPVGGYSQAGNTCDVATDYLTFSFFTTRAYDATAFVLSDLEVVGLNDLLPGDSCGGPTCLSPAPPVTPTPEPGTLALAMTGLFGVIGAGLRHRRRERAA